MKSNLCHTVHFLIDVVNVTTSQLATLTSVNTILNAFSADFYNSLKGLGPVTPVTTVMPDGVTQLIDAIPQLSSMLITINSTTNFQNLPVGNCFGSAKVFIPNTVTYGTPTWLQEVSHTIPGGISVNLTAADLLGRENVYDTAWSTVTSCLTTSLVKINNSISTPLQLSYRTEPSTTVRTPHNTVGRVLEVNETLWNALPDGNASTPGETKYNVIGRYLLLALNSAGTAYSGASTTLFHTSAASKKFSSKDISDIRTLYSNANKYKASFYRSANFK